VPTGFGRRSVVSVSLFLVAFLLIVNLGIIDPEVEQVLKSWQKGDFSLSPVTQQGLTGQYCHSFQTV